MILREESVIYAQREHRYILAPTFPQVSLSPPKKNDSDGKSLGRKEFCKDNFS